MASFVGDACASGHLEKSSVTTITYLLPFVVVDRGPMRSILICFQLLLGTGAVLQLDDQSFFSSSGIDHNTAPGLNKRRC